MSCWRSPLERLHLFSREKIIQLHSMIVDFPDVTTDLTTHQLSSAVLQMGSGFQMWWRMWVMCYFLHTLYMKGEKWPHPIHRVLLCSILGSLPRAYIFAEPGNVLLRGIPVVIMCRSPSGFEQFHLEKENVRTIDVTNTSSSKIAARFSLGPMSKDTTGGYAVSIR